MQERNHKGTFQRKQPFCVYFNLFCVYHTCRCINCFHLGSVNAYKTISDHNCINIYVVINFLLKQFALKSLQVYMCI